MKKIIKFTLKFITKVNENNLLSISNELTYKLLLALFPLIIFIMSIVGHLNFDSVYILDIASKNMPAEIVEVIETFVSEVVDTPNTKILSSSLLITIWSASSGFSAVIKGINRIYGDYRKFNFIWQRILSAILVLLFAVAIVLSTVLFVFSEPLRNFILEFTKSKPILDSIFSFISYILVLAFLFVSIVFIYKLSLKKKVTIRSVIPGALFSVIVWVISSKIFNIYVTNFSKYSKVYGSLAGVFLLMLWINLLSFFLLLGCQINAFLAEASEKQN